jgi:hypothetical protein
MPIPAAVGVCSISNLERVFSLMISETPNKNQLQLELNVKDKSFIIHMLQHGCQYNREGQESPPPKII